MYLAHSLGAKILSYVFPQDTSCLISDDVMDAGARLPGFQPWLCHLAV